ncbi:hypothetical protein MLD38_035120 [Melastoma candidum]|uniref:Uncharacterized protein n=1 Tax=Melastoma candidum TaxID=119954 RepID=A0ACB9MC32_9MYRT|nr:hypothetical protein MLD38_035120 [Melastoma candidum]
MALPLQMYWQPSLLSQKRQNGPPLGLRNLGNSCYLNSVLQCLTYTPPLANFCLRQLHSSLCDSCLDGERKRDCPFCILEKRIARSLRADHAQDSPAKIQSCLRLYADHFQSDRQEDAHEFLRYVIDACHNTCLRLMKLRHSHRVAIVEDTTSNTIVKEIFGRALQSQVKCVLCGAESNKLDEIMDISLDILHSASLKDALHKFFDPEVLDGNNKYKCEKCKKLVPARKQMSVFQAPNILVIQLKRFEGIYGRKIDKAISFEELLLLSNFLCKGNQDSSPEYYLFGTIVHAGLSPDSGHYYAYVKDAMGRWYCCNDSYVSVTTLEEVLSEKVYIMFYARTKQRPASSAAVPVASGVKSNAWNGIGALKMQPSGSPSKPAHDRIFEESACKNPPALPMADKLTSSPRVKFSISGNMASKRVPAVTNGKMILHENNSDEKSSNCKQPVRMKMNGKELSSSLNTNGFHKENMVPLHDRQRNRDARHEGYNLKKNCMGACHDVKAKLTAGLHGNGKAGGVSLKAAQSDRLEGNGTFEKSLSNGNVSESHESCNDGANHDLEMPISSGKMQDHSCILLAQDPKSREKVEELKEALKNEASAILRSSGWSDEVYSFMRAKRRKCSENAENASLDSNHLRKFLIAEARPTFISSIPESLKENFICRLRSFSEEKG